MTNSDWTTVLYLKYIIENQAEKKSTKMMSLECDTQLVACS